MPIAQIGKKKTNNRTWKKKVDLKPAVTTERIPAKNAFTPSEWRFISKHRTPAQVQKYLHGVPYNWEKSGETVRSFRKVLVHKTAHCLEAALLAATTLEQHGYPPLLLDIESKDNLDHVLFLFHHGGRWGTVAKSRELGLYGRKPVFRSVYQLVQSYIDPWVDRTGRVCGYGVADLRTLSRDDWRFSSRNLWRLEKALIRLPHRKIKTSTHHYHMVLRRYLNFKRKYPDGHPTFYSGVHRWM